MSVSLCLWDSISLYDLHQILNQIKLKKAAVALIYLFYLFKRLFLHGLEVWYGAAAVLWDG